MMISKFASNEEAGNEFFSSMNDALNESTAPVVSEPVVAQTLSPVSAAIEELVKCANVLEEANSPMAKKVDEVLAFASSLIK